MFFHSIKLKFISVISILIILLFVLGGFLLLKEKSLELSYDIYKDAKSFSELTASDITDLTEDYLIQDSFLIFNREVKQIFNKNDDIDSIYVMTYSGKVLYDSVSEWNAQYSGTERVVTDQSVVERIQARNPSYLLDSDSTVYINEDADGGEVFVDVNERPVEGIFESDRVVNIVAPVNGEYAIVYGVTYENLQSRINTTRERIFILMAIGVVMAFVLSYVLSSSIIKPVKALEMGALKIATGDFQYRVPEKGKDELGILSKAFNKMGKDLEISTKALVYKERMAKELELASKIQKEILPKEQPEIEGFDIMGGLIAADEVGGDCYDFIHGSNGDFYLYIGDVTGHGVPAGLVSSVANALLYSASSFTGDLKEILINVNGILQKKTTASMFMTMVLVKIDPVTGKVWYVSAGHNQILKYDASEKKVDELSSGGMALGMVADFKKTIQINEVEMNSGDVLVLYSDGIPEARDENDQQYGMPLFKRAVSEYCDLVTAHGIKNALLADVKEFMGKAVQGDDMTVLVIKKT